MGAGKNMLLARPMRDAPPPQIFFLILPLILVIGSLVMFVLSRVSGWSTLAPRYRTEMEPEPTQHVWWASVGGVSFNYLPVLS